MTRKLPPGNPCPASCPKHPNPDAYTHCAFNAHAPGVPHWCPHCPEARYA